MFIESGTPGQGNLAILDLAGTFVFALSGGMVAVRRRLDLFGVLVLSFAAATSGGIMRDVFLGVDPPAALADWRYVAVACGAGVVTFFSHARIDRLQSAVLVFDGAGLGLVAVTGALKALNLGAAPVTAVLLGMLTGIGGGMVRDVLASQIPAVFRSEIYAVAAMAGAAVVVTGDVFDLPQQPLAIAGALVCFGLRLMAIRKGWRLPVAGESAGVDDTR